MLHKEAPMHIIGFLCQQSIEKCLKGFLEEHDIRFPRTHDLVLPADLCKKIDIEFDNLKAELKLFEPFAVDVRYPGENGISVKKEEIEHLTPITERIFKLILKKIER